MMKKPEAEGCEAGTREAGESAGGCARPAAVEVPLAALVEDLAVYPRHAVDSQHVAGLVDALKAGVQLPPLVVEKPPQGKDTHRIVDGVHRYRALRRVIGPRGTASVLIKSYAGEAELILDAVALNSAHGRRLDRMDQARAVLLAEEAGASARQISVVLHVPEKRVEELRVRIAHVEFPDGPAVVLKRPAQHFAGKTMTEKQAAAHQSMPGTSLLLTARQLLLAIETDLVNPEDEPLRRVLGELSDALVAWLRARPPAAEAAA
jgi:ParB-like chromosome segregation protein Spo0J